MAYNLGRASRWDDGLNQGGKVGIFYEDTATPEGQSANIGTIVQDISTGKGKAWLKKALAIRAANAKDRIDLQDCRRLLDDPSLACRYTRSKELDDIGTFFAHDRQD